VNDTLGHEVGDELLRSVGRRLRRSLRPEDLVARLGGDEFCVFLPGLGEEPAARRAEVISACFDEPFGLSDPPPALGVSIGMAVWPAHGTTTDELLRHADMAMYQAKQRRRGPWPDAGAAVREDHGRAGSPRGRAG
jgi:diguanylate cyclase (GGDEF)-like protein